MKGKNEVKGYADNIPVYCAHDAIVPLGELRPNPKNPNMHPEEQLKRLGAIIRGAGWRNPITVSTRSGLIVRGHGRLAAAQLEGLTEAPVDYQNYTSDAEELADLKDRTQSTVFEDAAVNFSKLKKQEMVDLLTKLHSTDEPTTVIHENKPVRSALHPTMKPVALLLRLIKNSSRRGEIVYDPFGGSGSTLIACEQAERVCYTMELDPKYVDVIVKRYMLVTGKDDVVCIRNGSELSRREVSKLIKE